MSDLLGSIRSAVMNLEYGLSGVKLYSNHVDEEIYSFEDLRSTVQASTKILDEKEASIDKYIQDIEEFVEFTIETDASVGDAIETWKKEFYEE